MQYADNALQNFILETHVINQCHPDKFKFKEWGEREERERDKKR